MNAAKHGIDFVAAQALWLDENLIEIPAQTVDEPRSLVVGAIEQTLLGGHHAPRAASVSSRSGVLGRRR